MQENYQIDRTDRQILELLQEDGRMPFLDIARKIKVSGGTVHQRVDKLKKLGIIKGHRIVIDWQKMGLDVSAFLAVHLKESGKLESVVEKMKQLPEIVEVHYTTGDFALLVKVTTSSIKAFHELLAQKLQKIPGISSTESFVVLDSPIQREVKL